VKRVVRLLTAFTLASIFLLLSVLPVLAITSPDVGPTIDRVDVFRHCLEVDDMMVLVRYHLDYNTDPPETINQAYIGTFMDGIVELARVSPYTFYDKSYNHGVFSMYLDAGDAPAWNGAYTVTLEGNPVLDWQSLGATSAMFGAVAYDVDGVPFTNETAASNDAVVNDMTLLPLVPAVDDAYYFGEDATFDKLTLNIGTPGNGTWTVIWEYWDGGDWVSLTDVVDDTTGFHAVAGNRNVTFTKPLGWKETIVFAIDAYWIRARVHTVTLPIVQRPFGTQCWTNVGTPPTTSETVFTWHSTVNDAVTKTELSANIRTIAASLTDYWGYQLTEETASGLILSGYGTQYFANAIPNLRDMTYGIFSGTVQAPIYEEEEEEVAYRDILLNRWAGTMTGTAFTNLATWTTFPIVVVKGFIWLIVTGLVAYYMAVSARDMRYATFLAILMMPLGSLLGMLSLTFTIVGTLTCIIALGYVLFYQRSSG